MKLAHLALLAGFALVASCSIFPKTEPSDVYRLPSAQSDASAQRATPQRWSLRLAKPQTSEALNNPKIAVIPQGDLISSYKASRWSDPAPVLLRNRLLDGFQRDGRVPLLSTDDSNFRQTWNWAATCKRSRPNTKARRRAWSCAWMRCWCVGMTSESSPAGALKCVSR